MEQILASSLEGQGIWTVCAVLLTVYVLKTSGDREIKLHNIIDKLTEKFDILEDVKRDVNEIKDNLK